MDINDINKTVAEVLGWREITFTGVAWQGIPPTGKGKHPAPAPTNEDQRQSASSLECLVMRFVEIMDRQHTPTPYNPPKSTYDESYHGGDCEKHGRWYGICHSCQREQDRHYEDQQSEFDWKQKRDLRDLADEARRISHNK